MQYIDLDELQAELASAKARFTDWSAGVVKAADSAKQAHVRRMRSSREELADLQERHKQVERLANQVQQRMAQDDTEVSILQEIAKTLQVEQQALQRRVHELREGLDSQAQGLADQGEAVEGEESEQSRKLASLDRVLVHYQRALGLQMVPGEDELQLVFTQIDAAAPQREFQFGVRVQGDGSYQVTTCDPEVPALPELSQQLQQTNDFAGFVKAMRAEFVRAAAGPA